MSTTHHAAAFDAVDPVTDPVGHGHPPRVRHQAREALGVMTFSAVTSAGLAVALLLLAHLGR